MTISRALGAFVAGLELSDVPPAVSEKLSASLLNAYGMALCGLGERPTLVAARAVASDCERLRGAASLLAARAKVDASAAVFANAALFHARAQDDTLGAAHFGTAIVPLLTTLCEARPQLLDDLLPATLAGYEVGAACETLMGQSSTRRGFRSSPLYGPLASAAAVARLYRFDAQTAAAAIANAASFAGGIVQSATEGSDEWRYQVGAFAWQGFLAAQLARAGSLAARHPFDGRHGFARAFAGMEAPLELSSTREWAILRSEFKPYPVCAFNQSAVAAVLELRPQFAGEPLKALSVHLPSDAVNYPGVNNRGPFASRTAALLSMQFCAAVAVMDGEVAIHRLDAWDDRALLALADRIDVQEDAALKRQESKISVGLLGGRQLRIHGKNPMTSAMPPPAVLAMLKACGQQYGLGPSIFDELSQFVMALPRVRIERLFEIFASAREAIHPGGSGLDD